MKIQRRTFLKVAGVSGVALAAGTRLGGARTPAEKTEFFGILYDSTRCAGCQTCETSCAEANSLPAPTETITAGVVRKTDEKHRTVVNAFSAESGEVYLKKQCMHCNEPACTAACLTQAMYKTKEGPVIWRADKCMGCRYCMVSCPFDSPKFEYHSSNPKIEKCNMCYPRLQEGKVPACVENCPAEALTYGPRRELIAEARKRMAENPGQYIDHIYGEHEAGGTSFLYLAGVDFAEVGLKTSLQSKPYPELTKGFLYSVPAIFVLWPAMLLGMREATKDKNTEEDENR
ncbi:MAG: 4Fe-4S dicluster domain-containing protein [Bacteroidales bacterium]|jgi:Fe-S-cluster-containing dehydrogenase component|nr:4Fe-4S dicluster domain-containing protein [Bacteroidales bacterium]MCU0408679.1 4Fe-4S dicluster domain-containing protein [Bacteroidales bacterium]